MCRAGWKESWGRRTAKAMGRTQNGQYNNNLIPLLHHCNELIHFVVPLLSCCVVLYASAYYFYGYLATGQAFHDGLLYLNHKDLIYQNSNLLITHTVAEIVELSTVEL